MSADALASKPAQNAVLAFLKKPLVVALILIVLLLAVGEWLSPGFASPGQVLRLLIVAALLGIVAAGQNLVILGGREGIDLSVGGIVSLAASCRPSWSALSSALSLASSTASASRCCASRRW